MGRNKHIETPEKFWQYFLEYKKDTKSKPYIIKDWVGKDSNEVYREKEKPLTIEGFECWLFEEGVINNLSQYFANTEQRYNDYQTICSQVKKAIRKDQVEGGMAGVYNPSITQRLNGLVEKVQTDTKLEVREFTVRVIDDGDTNEQGL